MLSLLRTQIERDESQCKVAVSYEDHTIFSAPLNSVYGFLNVFLKYQPGARKTLFLSLCGQTNVAFSPSLEPATKAAVL